MFAFSCIQARSACAEYRTERPMIDAGGPFRRARHVLSVPTLKPVILLTSSGVNQTTSSPMMDEMRSSNDSPTLMPSSQRLCALMRFSTSRNTRAPTLPK